MTDQNHHSNNFPALPQRVTGQRLILRPSTRADISFLQTWWNDPAIMGPGGNVDGMQYDNDDMEDWFRRYVDGRTEATHFVICLRDPEETPIGEFYIACDDRPGAIDFALLIGDTSLWGKGYAREAILLYAEALFKTDCCQAMRINARRDNQRAIRLCKGVGFEIEHVWANGEFQTMILTQAAYEWRKYKEQNEDHSEERPAPAQAG
jgi:RimJ/RimL family protein N-acetyltransferase